MKGRRTEWSQWCSTQPRSDMKPFRHRPALFKAIARQGGEVDGLISSFQDQFGHPFSRGVRLHHPAAGKRMGLINIGEPLYPADEGAFIGRDFIESRPASDMF